MEKDRKNENVMLKEAQQVLPGFCFRLLQPEEKRALWSPDFELIFLLQGTGRVSYEDGELHKIQTKDVFAINRFELCDLDLDGKALALSLCLSAEMIASFHIELLKCEIKCRSFLYMEDQQEKFDLIRRDMAQIFLEMYKSGEAQPVYMKSRVTTLLEDLLCYFTGKEKEEYSKNGRERVQKASDYILQHYKEEITLEDLADHLYLSRAYISRSFPRYFGVSFLEYVTQVRLAHAVQKMHSDATLTEIAYDAGFANETAMIRAFRKYRGVTPGEYRKQMEKAGEQQKENIEKEREEDHDLFQSLLQYVAVPEQKIETTKETACSVTATVNGRKQRIAGHWKRVINAGYAASVLNREVQEELELLMKKVGYEFIRIKGILDDDMCTLRRDLRGEIRYCWNYIDEVIDFILTIGAKPMLEFSHMPELLAADRPGNTMRPAFSAPPEKPEQWRLLIRKLMEHLRERYGTGKLRRWIFVPWIGADMIATHGIELYLEIYKISYEEIKRISPEMIVCFPFGLCPEGYLEELLRKMKEENCIPEIFSFRSFGTVLLGKKEDDMDLIVNSDSVDMIVSRDPNFLQNRAVSIRKKLQKAETGSIPVLVDECSSNIWQRDLCNDTCYKAAWLFKNLLENEEYLQGIAYFSVNDRLDEVLPPRDIFHGGFGLFTTNGIPKAVCTALGLLGKMGSRLVKQGDGYFISTEPSEHRSQIYLYNYVHYDMLYRYRHAANISRTDRYRVFNLGENRTFSVKLTGLEPGKYRLRLYKITKEHGSSYDAWVRMGAPERMNRMETKILYHSADPEYRVWEQETDDEGILTIQERLEPHETALIEVEEI